MIDIRRQDRSAGLTAMHAPPLRGSMCDGVQTSRPKSAEQAARPCPSPRCLLQHLLSLTGVASELHLQQRTALSCTHAKVMQGLSSCPSPSCYLDAACAHPTNHSSTGTCAAQTSMSGRSTMTGASAAPSPAPAPVTGTPVASACACARSSRLSRQCASALQRYQLGP